MTSLGRATLVAGGHLPIFLDPQIKSEEKAATTVRAVEGGSDMPRSTRDGDVQAPSVPRHPISSMQDAFAESLVEATGAGAVPKLKLRSADATARRKELLGQGRAEPPPGVQWRFRPGQLSHELRRLMAQISFGVYLLLNGLANSQDSVVSILQGHIDEVDECLEVTLEDLLLAQRDLDGRTDHLHLVLNNVPLFQQMLENRDYRQQIVDGNENIEHILARSEIALAQNMQDVTEGIKSAGEFSSYLAEQEDGDWRQERPDVVDIFDAMKSNAEGWTSAFLDFQAKGDAVNKTVSRLKGMVTYIDQMAGEISRKTRFNVQPCRSPSPDHSSGSSQASSNSTLMATPPISATSSSSQPSSLVSLSRLNRVGTPGSENSYFDLPLVHEAEVPPLAQRRATSEAQTVPSLNPRQIEDPFSGLKIATNETEEDGNTLYVLQPRIYSTHPPSFPCPSEKAEGPKSRSIGPLRLTGSPGAGLDSSTHRSQPSRKIIDSRNLLRSSPTSLSSSSVSDSLGPISRLQAKRPSLRQRVALKTTPPEAIQVPKLGVDFYEPARQSLASDNSLGHERPWRPAAADGSTAGLSLPSTVRPALVPSPHLDRPFVRPVQANPHSALQQRPHTAYTVGHPPSHRTTKSAMGMTTLSSVTTTMTNDRSSSRALKKKRSAFGWLKKAFSLDEEERAIFEQKRQQRSHNPYQDSPSPQFLDGRRLPSSHGIQSRSQLQLRYGMQSPESLQQF